MDIIPYSHFLPVLSRAQQLSQRARLLQIIGKFSIFTAMDYDSCWMHQIHS